MEASESMSVSIAERVAGIRERIIRAALRVGRDAATVKLMAVTKTVSEEQILEAIVAGVDLLGESYVQEAKDKIAHIGRPCPWHLIGHLQTNKAKYAVRLFDMIHSVDRMEIALTLQQRCLKERVQMDVLIEVNVSGEASKWGVTPGEVMTLIQNMAPLDMLRIRGLMTMAPWSEDPEHARPVFSRLRALRDEISRHEIPRVTMEELSMGMSDDFDVAVEEGATMVRIGRAIFGERVQ